MSDFFGRLWDLLALIFSGIWSNIQGARFWFRKFFDLRILGITTFVALLSKIGDWISEHLWAWASSTFVSFLEGLGLDTPQGMSATGLTGWFVDLFALDVVGQIIVNYFLIILSARILLYVAFSIRQLTRVIP